MLNAVKHLSRYTAAYVFGALGGCLAYPVFFKLLFGASESGASFISGAIFGICMMLCFALLVSLYSSYASMALSMGATRNNLFLAIQLQKLFIAVGMFINLLANNYFVPFLFGGSALFSLDWLVILGSVCVFFASLGESIGVLCVRYGKIGMYIYIGICALFGAAIGIMFVLGNGFVSDAGIFIAGLSVWTIFAVSIILSVAVSFINWLVFKKTSIKL